MIWLINLDKTRRLITLALILSLGICLQLFESIQLPASPIMGAKLGLANIASLVLISFFTWREAIINAAMRTIIASLLLGTFLSSAFFFSLAGALVSTLVMLIALRLLSKSLSLVGISILGALAHNFSQMIVAYIFFVRHAAIFFELPVLMLSAVFSGSLNGYLTHLLISRVKLLFKVEGCVRPHLLAGRSID